MNRRNFIFKSMLVFSGFGALIQPALAAIIWVKEGTSGYKNVAPPAKAKANQKCLTCKHFKDDKKISDGGLCTLKAVVKNQIAYVKKEGHCSMWVKKV